MKDAASSKLTVLRWSLPELLRSSFEPLFRTYVYMLVLLPSGNLLGLNVKTTCFTLLFVPTLARFLENRRTTLLHVSLLISVPLVFTFWLIVSQVYDVDSAFAVNQYRELIILLASCWIAAVFLGSGPHHPIRFLRMLVHAEICACALKVFLLGFSAARGIPISVLVNTINNLFKVNLMGMDFESAFGRIQFVSDGLLPICIYVLLRYRHRLDIRSTSSALVIFSLLTISLVFTFSRYFWAFGALAFVAGLIVGRKDRFHITLLALLSMSFLVSLPFVLPLITLRFATNVATDSDGTRVLQTQSLVRYFWDAPVLGHGFGSHTSEVVRSAALPYVYEVQIYALAGQIGVIGLIVMFLLGLYYFHLLWFPSKMKIMLGDRVLLVVLLVAWLAAGLFNPMLLSSAAALSYASIKALSGTPADSSIAARNDERGSLAASS